MVGPGLGRAGTAGRSRRCAAGRAFRSEAGGGCGYGRSRRGLRTRPRALVLGVVLVHREPGRCEHHAFQRQHPVHVELLHQHVETGEGEQRGDRSGEYDAEAVPCSTDERVGYLDGVVSKPITMRKTVFATIVRAPIRTIR